MSKQYVVHIQAKTVFSAIIVPEKDLGNFVRTAVENHSFDRVDVNPHAFGEELDAERYLFQNGYAKSATGNLFRWCCPMPIAIGMGA